MTPLLDRDTRRRVLTGLGLGSAAGLLSGLFGVGGGVVIVPGLVLLLGVAQHAAHATSLAAILLIAPAAMVGFALDGSVAYVEAALLAAAAIAGAFVGAGIMHRIPARQLTQAFAVFMLVVAARMAVPTGAGAGVLPGGFEPLAVLALLATGLLTGMLSSIMGVGGGLIMVPALVLLFGFPQHLAEGTSLLVVIPTALVGAVRHTARGYTDWRLGTMLGAGGVLAGLVGAQVALAVPGAWLQVAFAVLLGVMAVRMLLKARTPSAAQARTGSGR